MHAICIFISKYVDLYVSFVDLIGACYYDKIPMCALICVMLHVYGDVIYMIYEVQDALCYYMGGCDEII